MALATASMRVKASAIAFLAISSDPDALLESRHQRADDLRAQAHELAGIGAVNRGNRACLAQVSGPGGAE